MKNTNKIKRIVLKIGSSLVISNGKFNSIWFNSFVEDVVLLKKRNVEILIVVSGAVALGKSYLKFKKKKLKIHEKQVCAACGQVILMNNFKKAFEKKNIKVAQILLTFSDTEDRKKSLNSRETITELMKFSVIPVVNENDSVAIDELKFGDNDRLAARVAQIICADQLVLLSDVDGLYTKNPKENSEAELITEVTKINEKIFKMASSKTNLYGTGGMNTKLLAAQIASKSGCETIIIKGNKKNPIRCYLKNKKGTKFLSKESGRNRFKEWLAGSIKISGTVIIDKGAEKALFNGASILPSGVQKISGKFSKGDIINIKNNLGKKIGKGITFYDSVELSLMIGKRSSEIKSILGYNGRDEIVHRDYLTLDD